MSKFYKLQQLPSGKHWNQESIFGKARGNQTFQFLEAFFDEKTLFYLDERIINHLLDSLQTDSVLSGNIKDHINDFSFLTAPAYKALEGFLFQIARDLKLRSSGNENFAGSYYFDEEKVDKHVDKIIRELEKQTEATTKLSKYEKQDIKDRIKEMKGFLQHYRNTPAHFQGEVISTTAKADVNIKTIYGIINNTTKVLLNSGLAQINDDLH